MKTKVLKYIRAVVFIAVIAGLVKCIDFAMMPSGYIRYIIHAAEIPVQRRDMTALYLERHMEGLPLILSI